MANLEKIAEEFELTVDYLEDEFILDNELHIPSLYMEIDDDQIVFYDYDEEVKISCE